MRKKPSHCSQVVPSSGHWWVLQTQNTFYSLYKILSRQLPSLKHRCVWLCGTPSPPRLISASSCWGSSDNRSYWRGWWGWYSIQTPPCSWCWGSRTLWTGCSPCAGGTWKTAAGEAANKVRISMSYFPKIHCVYMHNSRHTEQQLLTSCRDVMYRFHHRYFCMWGPIAARP